MRTARMLLIVYACRVLVRSYTWKSYDMQQTMQQGRAFALSVAITLAMHVWKGYKAPMLAACLQPIFMFIDPIFQTRVLGVDKVVERPVSDQFKKCASCSEVLGAAAGAATTARPSSS